MTTATWILLVAVTVGFKGDPLNVKVVERIGFTSKSLCERATDSVLDLYSGLDAHAVCIEVDQRKD